MQVNGGQTIFRKEHNGVNGTWYSYSTPVAKKDENGKWHSVWFEVTFVKEAKGTVLEDRTRINIKDAFMSVRTYTNKNGEEVNVPQVVVKQFDEAVDDGNDTGFSALSYDDVPF